MRLIIADAAQTPLPANAPCGDGLAFFWIGDDSRGVHQDARLLVNGSLQPSLTLPLPPTHPYDQTALAAPDGNCLLFWLDADQTGSNRLFVALLDRALTLVRGPTALSDSPTYTYAATLIDGIPWAAWSAGSAAEPDLDATSLDAAARPRPAQRIARAADHPAWVQASPMPILSWLSETDGSVWQATYDDTAQWSAPARLTSGVYRAPGDQIEAVRALQGYFEWSIRRADGRRDSWGAGEGDGGLWGAPTALELQTARDGESEITDARGLRYRLGSEPHGDRARLWIEPLTEGD